MNIIVTSNHHQYSIEQGRGDKFGMGMVVLNPDGVYENSRPYNNFSVNLFGFYTFNIDTAWGHDQLDLISYILTI